MAEHPECEDAQDLVFRALTEKRTYPDRILFHGLTTYLYGSKGKEEESLAVWMRVIRNLTLNSQIDSMLVYRRAIEGINGIAEYWSNLFPVMAQRGRTAVNGFLQEQVDEEQTKAKIILQDPEFAVEIYHAEAHGYFSGQIRSGLYLAKLENGMFSKVVFAQYWLKIAALFDSEAKKPKFDRQLLRRALFTFGDYTLPVGSYHTLCVDDADEAAGTPSMKRLFSNAGAIVKQLLDAIDDKKIEDVENQRKEMVKKSTVAPNDWRNCFIQYPEIFNWMSVSHYRIRKSDGKVLLLPNQAANANDTEVFTAALRSALKRKGILSRFDENVGAYKEHFLIDKNYSIIYQNGKLFVRDTHGAVVFETKTSDFLNEMTKYLGSL